MHLLDILDPVHHRLLVLALDGFHTMSCALDGFNVMSCTELPEILCIASTIVCGARRQDGTIVYFQNQIAEQQY